MTRFLPRFIAAFLFLVVLTLGGAIGYAVIEGASFSDALYMSAITLTAVGYEEVVPLSQGGRAFTMLVLIGGFAWMGLWFALITSLIVESDLHQTFRKRRMMKGIDQISGHVVICGGGRSGRQVAEELAAMGERYVVIERDPKRVEKFLEMDPSALVLEGNATVDQILQEAGIDRARALIACISSDTDNLFVCLSARHLSDDLLIVARAQEDEAVPKMYRAGANHVVSPMVSGAVRMASVILRPAVLSFLDVTTSSSEISLRLEEATIGSKAVFAGGTLADARIPEETGLLVIAVRKRASDAGHEFVFNPAANTRLETGDDLIVLGRPDQLRKLRRYVHA